MCEQHVPSLRKYRFGVKRQAVSWLITMCESHDLALFRTRCHHEIPRADLVELDDKRMVAADAKWGRESCEEPPAVMANMRGPSMQTCAHDASAENAPNTLMSEADAENWDATHKLAEAQQGH